MTFIFEVTSGDIFYVDASDLADAIGKYEHQIASSVSSDPENVHVYVQIF